MRIGCKLAEIWRLCGRKVVPEAGRLGRMCDMELLGGLGLHLNRQFSGICGVT